MEYSKPIPGLILGILAFVVAFLLASLMQPVKGEVIAFPLPSVSFRQSAAFLNLCCLELGSVWFFWCSLHTSKEIFSKEIR